MLLKLRRSITNQRPLFKKKQSLSNTSFEQKLKFSGKLGNTFRSHNDQRKEKRSPISLLNRLSASKDYC